MKPSTLTTPNAKLAYHLSEGANPTVIFMGGFKSDMTGSKATALEAFCRARGQRFIRFDYTGHGQSSGDLLDGTIGAWKQDALDVVDALGGEEIILVGSSMGAWLALLVTRERSEKIKALIGVASAPDFTEELIWKQLNDSQQIDLISTGVFYAPSCYGEEPYPITKKLIEEAREHLLLTPSPLEGEGWGEGYSSPDSDNITPLLTSPPIGGRNLVVRLIHGDKDADVPWKHSVKLMERLETKDAHLTLVKGGDHRMSAPEHLQLLCRTLETLLPNL